MKAIVRNNERGLAFRGGRFRRLLQPGVYRLFGSKVTIVGCRAALEAYGEDFKNYAHDPEFAESVCAYAVKDNEVAFHFVDGVFAGVLNPGAYTFFKEPYVHSLIVCDTQNFDIPDTVPAAVLNSEVFAKCSPCPAVSYLVPQGYEGILLVDGGFVRALSGGRHWFFNRTRMVEVKVIDKKICVLPISGQELLTADKVELRINFNFTYRVTDAVKAATAFTDYRDQLYQAVQLALREYIAACTLDGLLETKHEIGNIILKLMKPREDYFGAEFIEAGIKDVILPGDVKDILNTVLIAEKRALANVITRREETASTRSLLNTARLMDENQTLYRLKELEYLERICDKVGSISLSNGGNVLEQLSDLISRSNNA